MFVAPYMRFSLTVVYLTHFARFSVLLHEKVCREDRSLQWRLPLERSSRLHLAPRVSPALLAHVLKSAVHPTGA